MWPFSRKKPKPLPIPKFRAPEPEKPPGPIEVEEADTSNMSATGIFRAWKSRSTKDPGKGV